MVWFRSKTSVFAKRLRDAEARMLSATSGRGVTSVMTVTGMPRFPGGSFWLVVGSDRERDELLADALWLLEQARTSFRGAGFSDENVARARATVESEETVDRDFGGNWWARMK